MRPIIPRLPRPGSLLPPLLLALLLLPAFSVAMVLVNLLVRPALKKH